jgi:hypothetical protein
MHINENHKYNSDKFDWLTTFEGDYIPDAVEGWGQARPFK